MKNKQALYLLLAANAVSGFAQGVSIIAVPWYFINVLEQEVLFGLIFMVITFSTLFWTLYSGTLVDRYPRKTIFLGLNMAGFLLMGLATCSGYISGEVPPWLVAGAFAGTIFIFNVHYPSLYAFAQEITEKEKYGKISSLLEVQGQATTMLSGAMAAFLLAGSAAKGVSLQSFLPFEIVPWEMHEIFLMDTITYCLAFAIIAFIRYQPIQSTQKDKSSLKERFQYGWRFLKQNPLLFRFGVASYVVFVVLIVEGFYLISIYVSHHLQQDASVYAVSEMSYSVGALFAGFFIRRLFRSKNQIYGIVFLMILTAFICFVVAVTKVVVIFYLFSILIGVSNAGVRILRVTYLFEHIPNHVIGRAGSIFNFLNIFMRGLLLGLFSLPFFSESNHVVYAYLICGVLVLLAVLPIAGKYSALKELPPAKAD